MKIYTKTGDKGQTSLGANQRGRKNAPLLDAVGTLDECSSTIGLAVAFLNDDILKKQLASIQGKLFEVGALLTHSKGFSVTKEDVKKLEEWIDALSEKLPPLKHFILPGGSQTASALHLARAVCRRAERCVVAIMESEKIPENVAIYLNRLSDYLFVAARLGNHELGHEETPGSVPKVFEQCRL